MRDFDTNIVLVENFSQDDIRSYTDFLSVVDYSSVQYSLGFLKAISQGIKTETYVITVISDGRIVGSLPFCVRRDESGIVINSLPVSGSYGGPIVLSGLTAKEKIYEAIFSALDSFARKKGCLSVTLVTSPFDRHKQQALDLFRPDLTWERFTQVLELKNVRYQQNVKDALRKAAKFNFEIKEGLDAGSLQEFYDCFRMNMDAIEVAAKPLSFYKAVNEHMVKSGNAVFLTARTGGKLVAGIMMLAFNKKASYFTTCLHPEYKNSQVSSLLIDYALNKFCKDGFILLDFEASSSRESGVYKFKERWGAKEEKYHYLTKLYAEEKIKLLGMDYIKKRFEWFYVIPFSRFSEK